MGDSARQHSAKARTTGRSAGPYFDVIGRPALAILHCPPSSLFSTLLFVQYVEVEEKEAAVLLDGDYCCGFVSSDVPAKTRELVQYVQSLSLGAGQDGDQYHRPGGGTEETKE